MVTGVNNAKHRQGDSANATTRNKLDHERPELKLFTTVSSTLKCWSTSSSSDLLSDYFRAFFRADRRVLTTDVHRATCARTLS